MRLPREATVREYLRDEIGETYTFYDTEDSILDSVIARDESCGILIFPAGDSDDGSSLLHGEGVVLFDRGTLMPTVLQLFG